ncbi:CAP and S-layer homology domain-containing protein [Sporosarcina ureae]|uniref:CAP and S-layer homology domain-containing protein n=1 Tax=Sporosarcina ureae TaxID=1571 RepID=UPI0028A6BE35|nr:S-layer homology domain-containing protein [Sporosarcina ureae]
MSLVCNKKIFLSTIAMSVAVSAGGIATSVPIEAAKAVAFKDVPEKHYAYDAVMYMAANDIIKGYADNTYRLNKPVTRAQAAKMIAVSIGAKPSHAYKMDFKDVTKDNGSYDHIRALTQRGLFKNAEKFNPNKPLTRGQMAKLLVLGYHIVTDDNDFIIFDDVKKSSGAYEYIITIAELNITTTRPGGKFNPNDPVTRGQLAAFLYRTMQFDENRKNGLITYDNQKKGYVDRDKNLIKPNPNNQKPAPEKPKPVPPKPTPKPPASKPEPPKPTPVPPKPEPEQPSLAAQSIINVNIKRKDAKVSNLLADPALNRMASARAEDLAKLGELSHITPTHGTLAEMLDKSDYKWAAYGENIGAGFTDALEITNAWLASPAHKENLLSPVFTHMGAGTAPDSDGKIYWVTLYTKK